MNLGEVTRSFGRGRAAVVAAPAFLGDASACGPPDGFSSSELASWATGCGESNARDWIAQETGVHVVLNGDQSVNWSATAEIMLATESGLPVVTNGDGSVNWVATTAKAADVPLVLNADGSPNVVATGQAVAQSQGVPLVLNADGSPNWQGTAQGIIASETGVSVDLAVVNPDGSVKWEVVAEDAGSIGGAAVCTGVGAGVAAPVCSFAGGKLGGALYQIGAAVVDLFTRHDLPPPTPLPTSSDTYNFAVRSLVVNERDMVHRLMAMRSVSFLVRKTVIQMIGYWHATTGEVIPPGDMYAKLLAAGLSVPPGWATWFRDYLIDYGLQESEVDVYGANGCAPVKQGTFYTLVHTTIATVLNSAFGLGHLGRPGTDDFAVNNTPVTWRVEAGIDADVYGGTWQPSRLAGQRDWIEDPGGFGPTAWPGLLPRDFWDNTYAIDAWVLATSEYGGRNVAGPLVLVRQPNDVSLWTAPHDERLINMTGIPVGKTPNGTCRAPLKLGVPAWGQVIAAAPEVQVDLPVLLGVALAQGSAHIITGLCRIDINAEMYELVQYPDEFDAERAVWLASIPKAVSSVRAAAILRNAPKFTPGAWCAIDDRSDGVFNANGQCVQGDASYEPGADCNDPDTHAPGSYDEHMTCIATPLPGAAVDIAGWERDQAKKKAAREAGWEKDQATLAAEAKAKSHKAWWIAAAVVFGSAGAWTGYRIYKKQPVVPPKALAYVKAAAPKALAYGDKAVAYVKTVPAKLQTLPGKVKQAFR